MNLRVSTRIIENLINTSGITPCAKALYICVMMNQIASIQALCDHAGMDYRPVVRHLHELEGLGWMRLVSEGRSRKPEALVPRDVEENLASEILTRIRVAAYKGEETTRAFVDWIVAPSVRLLYCIRPPFLLNRATGQNLECDIFAPEFSWAMEHQGDQHFEPTNLYPSKEAFIERVKRDRLKAALCKEHGIRLSAISKEDLTLARMDEAIPQDIPRRAFDPSGPVIEMLEKVGRELVAKGERDRDT